MICADGAEWKRRVCSVGCQVHGDRRYCEGPLQAHHVLLQQHLRKYGLDSHRWDTDVGMAVCKSAHDRHHSAKERIPYECVPDAAIRFAFEHGIDYLLDRYYPHMEVRSGDSR